MGKTFSAYKGKDQIPPTPVVFDISFHARDGYFVEGGASMDPSFSKRGWGDLQPLMKYPG